MSSSKGIVNTFDYSISDPKLIFDYLTNQIYSRKIEAVIREISTNALDAMIAAGRPNTPIKVTLPTENAPEFVVRDFGDGLSFEPFTDENGRVYRYGEMESIYTTIGGSKNRNLEATNGEKGLGSKSPFCYTDSFITTSWQNGKKIRGFSSVSRDEGLKMGMTEVEEAPGELDGLEVRVPVRPGDIATFHRLAKKIYRWYPITPDISPEIPIKLPPYVLSGKDWAIEEEKEDNYFSSLEGYVVCGNVQYDLDMSVIQYSIRSLIPKGRTFYLFFPPGALDIPLEREKLQYTEKTVNLIVSLIQRMHTEMTSQIAIKVASQKTKWDARVLYNEKYSSFPVQCLWNKERVPAEFKLEDGCGLLYCVDRNSARRLARHVKPDKKTRFLIADIERGKIKAACNFARQNPDYNTYLCTNDPQELATLMDCLDINDDSYFENVSKYYEKGSTAGRISSTKGSSQSIKIFKYNFKGMSNNPNRSQGAARWWDTSTLTGTEKDKTYYYYSLNRFKPKNNPPIRFGNSYGTMDALSLLNRAGVIPDGKESVYGIRYKDVINLPSNWRPVHELVKDIIDNLDVQKTGIQHALDRHMLDAKLNDYRLNISFLFDKLKYDGTAYKQLLPLYNIYKKGDTQYVLRNLIHQLGLKVSSGVSLEVDKNIKRILSSYPLTGDLLSHNDASVIINYVDKVEGRKEL